VHKRAKNCSASGATFATILVGADEKPFVVHEALLTHHSDFFRAALTGRFKEAEDKTVKLPEESADMVEFFVHWLYTKRFPSKAQHDSQELIDMWMGKNDDGESTVGSQLIGLYVFGNRFQLQELCRKSLDTLFNRLRKNSNSSLPDPGTVSLVFARLPHSSPLCRFLVDAYCNIGDDSYYAADNEDEYPDSFLLAILRRYARDSPSCNGYIYLDLCDYHGHKDNEERGACKAKREKK